MSASQMANLSDARRYDPSFVYLEHAYIDGLVQDSSNSSALAILLQYCTEPTV